MINKTINSIAAGMGKFIFSEHDLGVFLWKLNNLEELRYDYDLNRNSTVFDLGGYKGEWAEKIYAKYQPNIYIFEPVEEFAREISVHFKNNKKVHVYNFGLSSKTGEMLISLEENKSSEFKKGGKKVKVRIKSIKEFLIEESIGHIDLMKINIEGGEYDLLENIILIKFIGKIKNVQVQFHNFINDAEKRMSAIQKNLAKTHSVTYQHKFIWENWLKK